VLAGCEIARANVDGGLGWGRAWRSDCSFVAKQQVGGARDWRPAHKGFLTGSEFESSADAHHRRAPGVDRADGLLGVDPLEVHAGRGHIRVAELALDYG
jgi:hypothetical protein